MSLKDRVQRLGLILRRSAVSPLTHLVFLVAIAFVLLIGSELAGPFGEGAAFYTTSRLLLYLIAFLVFGATRRVLDRWLQDRAPQERSLIVRLFSVWAIAAAVLATLVRFMRFSEDTVFALRLLTAPLSLLVAGIPLLIVLVWWGTFRVGAESDPTDTENSASPAEPPSEEFFRRLLISKSFTSALASSSEEFFRDLLRSERFTTALTSALPTGEEDRENGLDFVPFMLQRIELRRLRFTKSSRLFLALTVGLGLVFIAVLIYFGYILINEAAAGAPRALKSVSAELRNANSQLEPISPEAIAALLDESGRSQFRRLARLRPDSARFALAAPASDAIDTYERDGDLDALENSLSTVIQSFGTPSPRERLYVSDLEKAVSEIRSLRAKHGYVGEFVESSRRLREQALALQRLMPRLEQQIGVEDRLLETVKRLAVGLIVTTFFLALLRYCASLYRDHHGEMVLAEGEDMSVRRFYVAFKGADPQERGKIAHSFLELGRVEGKVASKEAPQSPELGMLKEILAALSKKL